MTEDFVIICIAIFFVIDLVLGVLVGIFKHKFKEK